jgi:hypothetical protein
MAPVEHGGMVGRICSVYPHRARVTGGHGRDLTPAQLVAHCIALAVVAVIVATAQRRVLTQYVPVNWTRVVAAAVAFTIAFQIGYYQTFVEGPDTDILLGFLVLGSVVWLGNVSTKGHRVAAPSRCSAFRSPALSESLPFCRVYGLHATQLRRAPEARR